MRAGDYDGVGLLPVIVKVPVQEIEQPVPAPFGRANATVTFEDAREEPTALDGTYDLDQPGERRIQWNWMVVFEQLLEDRFAASITYVLIAESLW